MGDAAYPPGYMQQVQQPWQPGQDPNNRPPPPQGQPGPMGTEPGRDLSRAPQMNIPGYEGTNFMKGYAVMPPQVPPPPRGDPPPLPNTDLAKLDEGACRDAMIQHVNENCCYGSKPAQEMQMTKIEGVTALHLTLETFAEGRETKNKHEPYKGGHVDGPHNGRPPAPWEMEVPPLELFKTHKVKREVPHTAEVRPCWECDHRGWKTCWRCHGHGRVHCNSCNGRGHNIHHTPEGHTHHVPCHTCHGNGMRSCWTCGGDGRVTCKECQGYTKTTFGCWTCGGDGRVTCKECQGYRDLRCFIQLVCRFCNHDDHFVLETTDMPDDLVTEVGGKVLFQDTQYLVRPVLSYPVAEINVNSDRMVKDHDKKWPSERVLKQRQTLRGVPVTEVAYSWDDVNTRFWVYGNERRVYAPDYPQQCCCGCSVL